MGNHLATRRCMFLNYPWQALVQQRRPNSYLSQSVPRSRREIRNCCAFVFVTTGWSCMRSSTLWRQWRKNSTWRTTWCMRRRWSRCTCPSPWGTTLNRWNWYPSRRLSPGQKEHWMWSTVYQTSFLITKIRTKLESLALAKKTFPDISRNAFQLRETADRPEC